jgi:hypothetical protein
MEERNRPGVYVRSIAEYERIYGRGPALAPLFVAYGIEEPKRWYKHPRPPTETTAAARCDPRQGTRR